MGPQFDGKVSQNHGAIVGGNAEPTNTTLSASLGLPTSSANTVFRRPLLRGP
jgi:hypothetical protein